MTAAEYLDAILNEQTLTDDQVAALDEERARVAEAIEGGLPESSPEIEAAGSYAKGTLIAATYDLDVVCYFPDDDNGAGDTLKDIYANVQAALESAYKVELKKSVLRLKGRADGGSEPDLCFDIDVAPGRFVDETEGDVFLYQKGSDKDRLKTNLRKHVSHVKDSGLVDVIRLAKLWKFSNGLDVKTFVLELVVIEVLDGKAAESHEANLKALWTALRDKIDEIEIEDPANPTGNDLAESFGDDEREALASAATLTLNLLEQKGWEAVFGPLQAAVEEKTTSDLVAVADSSHRATPPWPTRYPPLQVEVTCACLSRRQRWSAARGSDQILVTDGTHFQYRAKTNVPEPFTVQWQVVNTGEHARALGGLRGNEFLASKGKDGGPPSSPLVNWERAEYTGKHWIECFIVKDGQLWARSGPFYVSVVNRSRRGGRPYR